MILSVPQLLSATSATTEVPLSADLAFDAPEQALGPAVGDVVVTRTSDQLLKVTGSVRAPLQTLCDRCGEAYRIEVEATLDEALEVVPEAPTSQEVEESVWAHGELDLTDLVRQALLLALPSRKLCGCPALQAPAAGPEEDPRWAALRALVSPPDGQA